MAKLHVRKPDVGYINQDFKFLTVNLSVSCNEYCINVTSKLPHEESLLFFGLFI